MRKNEYKEILVNPALRINLPKRPMRYFTRVNKTLRLGYYRGRRTGSWFANLYLKDGIYKDIKIGLADDYMTADGRIVLSYEQALEKALKAQNIPKGKLMKDYQKEIEPILKSESHSFNSADAKMKETMKILMKHNIPFEVKKSRIVIHEAAMLNNLAVDVND